ncbi:MAG: precorrin-6y C5,15-methyltransferase (decarboxylating) subunit CbiE, partial [Pseudomonadota bacterium]
MANAPWITIVGLGEDGPEGLAPASQKALAEAEVVMGAKRHLSLLPDLAAEAIEWPVPFADGLELLRAQAGRSVVVLASGDPFWFGAGAVIAREFAPQDWRAYPGLSTFSLAASRLGWPLETTICLGLHAAPLQRLRPHLAPGARCLVLLRDGDAVQELATFLDSIGFGDSGLHVMEALGGPRERCTDVRAADVTGSFQHPVCVGITIAGRGVALPQTSGLSDTNFESDGVMTKRPIRALTLSALAPRA